jgi:hypothetical protein
MGSLANATYTLPSNLAQGGTFTVSYPTGTNQAALNNTTGGRVYDRTTQQGYAQGAGGFTFTFGASNITVTNDTGATIVAGDELSLSFGRNDINGVFNLTFPKQLQDKVAAL